MDLLKTLKYWLTPLKVTDPDFGTLTFIYMSESPELVPSSAHKKKNLYVRALSILSPSLLTSENSDGLRLFVASHSQIKL
jgi:hypothetical protein